MRAVSASCSAPGLGAPQRRHHPDAAMAISNGCRKANAELVAAAYSPSRGCAREPAKFGDFADGMLFTPKGRRRPASRRGPRGPVPAGRFDASRASWDRGRLARDRRDGHHRARRRSTGHRGIATVNLRLTRRGAARRRPRARPRGRGVDGVRRPRAAPAQARAATTACVLPAAREVLRSRARATLEVKVGPGIPTAIPEDAGRSGSRSTGPWSSRAVVRPARPEGPRRSALVLHEETAHARGGHARAARQAGLPLQARRRGIARGSSGPRDAPRATCSTRRSRT